MAGFLDASVGERGEEEAEEVGGVREEAERWGGEARERGREREGRKER